MANSYITLSQLREIEDAEIEGDTERLNKLLWEFLGINNETYVMSRYLFADGRLVMGNTRTIFIYCLLDRFDVEVLYE